MSDLKTTGGKPPSPPEPGIFHCLNPQCDRICDPKRAKVRVLGGRTVRYCCHHCMRVHAATGVITRPVPKF